MQIQPRPMPIIKLETNTIYTVGEKLTNKVIVKISEAEKARVCKRQSFREVLKSLWKGAMR